LQEDLIVDFVGEVAHEDMEVVRGIFFRIVVRLVGPVDTYLLLVHAAAVKGLHCTFCTLRIVVLYKSVVVALGLEL
jgi:hypothetical protein